MNNYEYSKHAYNMIEERGIRESWVKDALENPERVEQKDDGTAHYLKRVEEFGDRYLRVVVNVNIEPKRIVTVFFDRKLGGKS